jgi:hypothetical protein
MRMITAFIIPINIRGEKCLGAGSNLGIGILHVIGEIVAQWAQNIIRWVGNSPAVAVSAAAVGISVVSVSTSILFYLTQMRLAKEKLRHDLYDRRFAVYMAFHNLLIAAAEKNDAEAELRAANAARAHCPFLLEGLEEYLDELHTTVFRINATTPLLRDPTAWPSPEVRGERILQHGSDRLNCANRVKELAQKFHPFLRLRDFSKRQK